MIAYPKQDYEIELLTTDNSRITGLINVLGRSISTYLQSSEPDIIMYRCNINGVEMADTLMISKNETLWVHATEKSDKEQIGNWQKLKFRLTDGSSIKGAVNMSGYDRVSDYLQNFDDRFYEVYSAESDEGLFDMVFLSRMATVWKEPVA